MKIFWYEPHTAILSFSFEAFSPEIDKNILILPKKRISQKDAMIYRG